MLSDAQVATIQRLLNHSALSQRDIAREVGVSRGTVVAISRGRRRPRANGPPAAAEPEQATPTAGPAIRCGGCGALVYPPCRACRLRGQLAASAPPQFAAVLARNFSESQ